MDQNGCSIIGRKRQRKCPEASEKIQSREKKKQTGHNQDCLLGIVDSGLGDSKREDSRE